MNTRALVVGVDDYPANRLENAVSDAVTVRATLLALGLVAEHQVKLLTSPRVSESDGEATYDEIAGELEKLYRDGEDVERFIFYFAGHGLLAFKDVGMSQPGTAILPADVGDFEANAHKLIQLDELLGYMRLTGPREQLYFIDACRDLPYRKHPASSSLSWGGRTPGYTRRQAVLYAVSELGQANELDGRGRMTGHLVNALQARGCALDYDVKQDAYVVTMESIRNFVCNRIAEELGGRGVDLARALPSLDGRDPRPEAVRVVSEPPRRELTVHVVPDAAAASTKVLVGPDGETVIASWPPSPNHTSVTLPPRLHRLRARSTIGTTDPDNCCIDVREKDEATVRVSRAGPGDEGPRVTTVPRRPTPPDRRREDLAYTYELTYRPRMAPPPSGPGPGRLRVTGRDGIAGIDVIGLEPPYLRHSGLGDVDLQLPPGGYRVNFRFGLDVLASIDAYVDSGERVNVQAPESDAYRYRLSGPGLSTLQLQLIGYAPFARREAMPPELPELPGDLRQAASGMARPVVVVTAGDPAQVTLAAEPGATRLDVEPEPTAEPTFGVALDDRRQEARFAALEPFETPLGSAAIALLEAPGGLFEVQVSGDLPQAVGVASASLQDRVTVLTLRRTALGRLIVTQNLFPLRQPPPRPSNPRPYSELLASQLVIAQRLYESGELIEAVAGGHVDELLYGKWTDPIFGCLGVYASEDQAPAERPRDLLRTASRNLHAYFGALPDAEIAATVVPRGKEQKRLRSSLMQSLLDSNAAPLLARSAQLLAAYATETGQGDHAAVDRYAQIPAGQMWNLRPLG